LDPNALLIAVFEFVVLIFSLCFHECAHAWMASRLGDQTARLQGRVTLNPMYHVDPIGTLLFPALMIFGPLFSGGLAGGYLIGWAKPTPVITRNFRKIVRDDILVTLAGPVSNLILVVIATMGLAWVGYFHGMELLIGNPESRWKAVQLIFELTATVNLALFFFNLLPIPPLDGSRVLGNLLPYNAARAFDRLGMVSYMLMIFLGGPVVRMCMRPSIKIMNTLLQMVPIH